MDLPVPGLARTARRPWLLRNPVVSTTVIGAVATEELRLDLGALSV